MYYSVKILNIIKLDNWKTILKVELVDENIANIIYNNTKQTYYSDLNDEPMWQKISDDTMHFIFVYDNAQQCDCCIDSVMY